METEYFQRCIDACKRCAQACDECFVHCLDAPDADARRDCINALADCSGICGLTGFMMGRDSPYSKDAARLCAAICDRCAAECGAYPDDLCVRCAEECNTCAHVCRIIDR